MQLIAYQRRFFSFHRRAVRNSHREGKADGSVEEEHAGIAGRPMTDHGSPQKACIQCHDYKSLADFPR